MVIIYLVENGSSGGKLAEHHQAMFIGDRAQKAGSLSGIGGHDVRADQRLIHALYLLVLAKLASANILGACIPQEERHKMEEKGDRREK